ncbi:MAG TPA: AAA family ATPase [Gemmatimonadales bacterium]|jgi:cell division protease FtsH|nr:AAA family ATPase [Gemmatimonadales bacterium]
MSQTQTPAPIAAKQAREHAPEIIFIDELDDRAGAGTDRDRGGSSEQEQTLNQILTEMDGFSGRGGIIVLSRDQPAGVLERFYGPDVSIGAWW